MTFLGETEIKEKQVETPADILSRMDGRAAEDTSTLKRIERNTSLLSDLIKVSTLSKKLTKETAVGVRSAAKTNVLERTRDERGKHVAVEKPAKMERQKLIEAVSIENPSAQPVQQKAPFAPKQRDAKGRFGSNRKPEESQGVTLAGIITKALKGKVGENKGDIKDALGRSVLGGAGWEAAQQAMEAVGNIKEGMSKDEGLIHDLKGWGKGKFGKKKDATTTAIENTEKLEKKRHRELLQAIEGNNGGGAESGVDDAISSAVGTAVGLSSKSIGKTLLTFGSTFALPLTALAGGLLGLKWIFDKGNVPPLTPEQTKAIKPIPVSEEDKKRWRNDYNGGNVVSSKPGVTTIKTPDGAIIERTGDRNQRNNNPSNIVGGPFAKAHGAIGDDGRFAVFPSKEVGQKAQKELLFNKNKDNTLTDTIAKLSPPSENNTAEYQQAVLSKVGGRNKKMSEYTPAEQQKIMDAITAREGTKQGTERTIQPARTTPTAIQAPEPLKAPAATPLTATVPGMDRLITSMTEKVSPRSEKKTEGPVIKTEFEDTLLTLMAYDRI